jgi:hypothetical protein
MLRLQKFRMSYFTSDTVSTQFDQVEVNGRSMVVCKHCKRQLTGNRSAMCMHYRMKHTTPPADALNQIDSPPSTSDMPASNQLSDQAANNPLSDNPISSALPPDQPQARDVGMHKVGHPLSEKRLKDAARYLSLCAATPLAFRRAIDALPTSSIIRIYDLVCNAAKGDGQVKLSPKQLRLCTKYGADSRASSKTKRRLLRRANKEVVRSVFAPLMLQTALGATDGGMVSAALQAIATAKAPYTF